MKDMPFHTKLGAICNPYLRTAFLQFDVRVQDYAWKLAFTDSTMKTASCGLTYRVLSWGQFSHTVYGLFCASTDCAASARPLKYCLTINWLGDGPLLGRLTTIDIKVTTSRRAFATSSCQSLKQRLWCAKTGKCICPSSVVQRSNSMAVSGAGVKHLALHAAAVRDRQLQHRNRCSKTRDCLATDGKEAGRYQCLMPSTVVRYQRINVCANFKRN